MQTIDHDTLATLAEMGVTIIGIAGLVAVFLSRGTLHQADKVRFNLIILPAGSTAVGAYLPIWFGRHLGDQVLVWQYSAWILLAAVIVGFVTTTRSGYGFGSELYHQLKSAMNPYVWWASAAIPATNFVLLGINATSWPVQSNQTIYELSLVAGLSQATLQFASMVFYRPGDTA